MTKMLAIGEAEKRKIADLIALAEANPLSEDWLARTSAGFDPMDPATRNETSEYVPTKFTIDIPLGFTVTFTMERQPCGLSRHLSVSVGPGRSPHPVAVIMLMEEFGFERKLGDRQIVYPEQYGSGRIAINVIEPPAEAFADA